MKIWIREELTDEALTEVVWFARRMAEDETLPAKTWKLANDVVSRLPPLRDSDAD